MPQQSPLPDLNRDASEENSRLAPTASAVPPRGKCCSTPNLPQPRRWANGFLT